MCICCQYYLPISPYEGFCEKKKHLVIFDEYCFDFFETTGEYYE